MVGWVVAVMLARVVQCWLEHTSLPFMAITNPGDSAWLFQTGCPQTRKNRISLFGMQTSPSSSNLRIEFIQICCQLSPAMGTVGVVHTIQIEWCLLVEGKGQTTTERIINNNTIQLLLFPHIGCKGNNIFQHNMLARGAMRIWLDVVGRRSVHHKINLSKFATVFGCSQNVPQRW